MPIYPRLLCFLGCDVDERETAHPNPLIPRKVLRKFTRKLQTNFVNPCASGRYGKPYTFGPETFRAAEAG